MCGQWVECIPNGKGDCVFCRAGHLGSSYLRLSHSGGHSGLPWSHESCFEGSPQQLSGEEESLRQNGMQPSQLAPSPWMLFGDRGLRWLNVDYKSQCSKFLGSFKCKGHRPGANPCDFNRPSWLESMCRKPRNLHVVREDRSVCDHTVWLVVINESWLVRFANLAKD